MQLGCFTPFHERAVYHSESLSIHHIFYSAYILLSRKVTPISNRNQLRSNIAR